MKMKKKIERLEDANENDDETKIMVFRGFLL
jgi:hypothetical protein